MKYAEYYAAPIQVHSIFDDCLYNIVCDTVIKVHREEKIARMQSAAILAEQAKEREGGEELRVRNNGEITYSGAIMEEDGKIHLHGNPLRTTMEILCPRCRLPRLLHPSTGKGAQQPEPGKEYCSKQPYIEKAGCDIHGKSLVVENPSKKSKAAKDAKKQAEASPDQDNSDSDNGGPSSGKTSNVPAATTVPTTKCPNCPRYMAFSKIAGHLERCMGIGGRQSSKNAMVKMNSNTPRDSRSGTPKPTGNNKKRKLEKGTDDEDDDPTPQKKKKTTQRSSQKANGKEKAVNSNLSRVKSAEKRLPGQSSDESREKDIAKGRNSEAPEFKKEKSINKDENSD